MIVPFLIKKKKLLITPN